MLATAVTPATPLDAISATSRRALPAAPLGIRGGLEVGERLLLINDVFARLAKRLEDGTESEPGIALMSKLRLVKGDRPHRDQDMRIDATHVEKRPQNGVLTLSCPDCVGFKRGGPKLIRRRVRLDTLEAAARAALARRAEAFYVMSDGRLVSGV